MGKRSYSRIFTDLFPKRQNLKKAIRYFTGGKGRFKRNLFRFLIVFTVLFFSFLLYLSLDLYQNYSYAKKQRYVQLARLMYWEKVLAQHPNYTDAFYQAAISAARLGENSKAVEYLDSALVLDPYFKEAEELRRKILKVD